jgi:hypothetical protein
VYLQRRIRPLIATVLFGGASTVFAAAPVSKAELSPKDLPSGCALTKEDVYATSVHAASTFGSLIEEPSGGKTRQFFTCHRKGYTLYLYDYGDSKQALSQVAAMGARMWGDSAGPTSHHADEVLVKGSVIAVLSPSAGPVGQTLVGRGFTPYRRGREAEIAAREPVDLSPADLKTMKAAVDCKAQAFFCKAMDRFAKGKPVKGTGAPRALGGATLFVSDTGAQEEASYLVLSNEGALFGTVKPTSPEEEGQVKEFLAYVRSGKSNAGSEALMGYVRSLSTKPLQPTRAVGRSTVYVSNNHVLVREEGDALLVIERQPGEPDFYVALFPKRR